MSNKSGDDGEPLREVRQELEPEREDHRGAEPRSSTRRNVLQMGAAGIISFLAGCGGNVTNTPQNETSTSQRTSVTPSQTDSATATESPTATSIPLPLDPGDNHRRLRKALELYPEPRICPNSDTYCQTVDFVGILNNSDDETVDGFKNNWKGQHTSALLEANQLISGVSGLEGGGYVVDNFPRVRRKASKKLEKKADLQYLEVYEGVVQPRNGEGEPAEIAYGLAPEQSAVTFIDLEKIDRAIGGENVLSTLDKQLGEFPGWKDMPSYHLGIGERINGSGYDVPRSRVNDNGEPWILDVLAPYDQRKFYEEGVVEASQSEAYELMFNVSSEPEALFDEQHVFTNSEAFQKVWYR